MAKGFKHGAGGGTALNFRVVCNPKPENPKENTIWLDTDVGIPEWVFSATDPTIGHRDTDRMEGLTNGYGYFTDKGAIASQTASNPELYTEEYIPVKHGTTYNYTYTVSESNSMWLVICEYKEGETFSKRTVLVNSVQGTEQTGTYTPSSSDIVSVRLSWRTFADTTCKVSFVEKNAEYVIEGTPEGMVWFYTGASSTVKFNALKKNNITVYPLVAKQYVSGAWVDKTAKSYQNGAWVDWITYALRSGVDEIGLEAYQYKGASRSETAGVDYIEFTTTTSGGTYNSSTYGRATSEPVDLTGVNCVYARINVVKGEVSGGNSAGGGLNVATAKDQASRVVKVTQTALGEGILQADVSDLEGLYYITFGAYAYIDQSGSRTGTVRFYDVYWE